MTLTLCRTKGGANSSCAQRTALTLNESLSPNKLYEIKLLLRGAAYYAGSPVPWETFGPKGVLG